MKKNKILLRFEFIRYQRLYKRLYIQRLRHPSEIMGDCFTPAYLAAIDFECLTLRNYKSWRDSACERLEIKVDCHQRLP